LFSDTVSIAPNDSIAYQAHYGSMYTMVDYKSEMHNIFVNLGFDPVEKLHLKLNAAYNMSTAEMDPVEMPDITARLEGGLSHQDFTFDEMHEYSKLDYTMITANLGMEYKLAPDLTWTVDLDYGDLTDDAGYVYGIESGSILLLRTGIGFTF
jgi:hypothetical protein